MGIDSRFGKEIPELALAEQTPAEKFAAEYSFAVPAVFAQYKDGDIIEICLPSAGNCTPKTIEAHPVTFNTVSPASTPHSARQRYIVPGIYRISLDETLKMKYPQEGKKRTILTVSLGGWVVLTAVKSTRGKMNIGEKRTFYSRGTRLQENSEVHVRVYTGDLEEIRSIGTTGL